MPRVILHSDLNNFYASVECLRHPELREVPMVVGGSTEERHGVVLAKNELAKRYGVKTGEALWLARQKCAPLVTVQPSHRLYEEFSKKARAIYLDYTGQVEPFGIDEAWLDVTACAGCTGPKLADELRQRVKAELGLTVSIGVSYNKIFAKLGSDLKKPDAVTAITPENYRALVWPLSVSDLLYVGPATAKKLHYYGIDTIGQLAGATPDFLRRQLGKMGDILHDYANGWDETPVADFDELAEIKSIGNSTTTYRDLKNNEDVRMVLFALAESVAARVRAEGFYATTLSVSVRDVELRQFTRQCKLNKPSNLAVEYAHEAAQLFERKYDWQQPIRSIGLSVTDFCRDDQSVQLDMMSNQQHREALETLEKTMDGLRRRYGDDAVQRAVVLQDPHLTGAKPIQKDDGDE